LIDSKVLTCTALGSKWARCSAAAWKIKSLNGRANRASISLRFQSWRTAMSVDGDWAVLAMAGMLHSPRVTSAG